MNKILSIVQILTILGLVLEFGSFMIFTWEFLKGWIDHVVDSAMDQAKWNKIRRNAKLGIVILLLGLILQGATVFM